MSEEETENNRCEFYTVKVHLLQQMPFSGSFNSLCPSKPVSHYLFSLVDVLLKKPTSIAKQLQDGKGFHIYLRRERMKFAFLCM